MRKWHVGAILAIAFLVTLGAASNSTSDPVSKPDDEGFKNLKVLPKDITEAQLKSVMGEFSISLGVHCNFCHARKADSTQRGLDFASDAKDAKNTARYMYKMTAELNAKYFNWNNSTRPDTIHYVVCYTCHRGTNEPDAQVFLHVIDSTEQAMRRNRPH
jgi:photosynthetic reaction center cytochrome c subunit